MPAICIMLSIFVIPSLHTVSQTMQPCGLCEETTRAPCSLSVSAETATVDLYGLRAVGVGGVATSPTPAPRQAPFSPRRKHARDLSSVLEQLQRAVR